MLNQLQPFGFQGKSPQGSHHIRQPVRPVAQAQPSSPAQAGLGGPGQILQCASGFMTGGLFACSTAENSGACRLIRGIAGDQVQIPGEVPVRQGADIPLPDGQKILVPVFQRTAPGQLACLFLQFNPDYPGRPAPFGPP